LDLLEQELAAAKAAADSYAEKMSLDNLGLAWSECGKPERALSYYSRALDIARQVGDRQHESDLLWLSAVQYAELGYRTEAIETGEQAVIQFVEIGNPQAEMLADHLRQYREGSGDASLPRTVVVPVAFGSILSTAHPGAVNAGIEVVADRAEAVGPGILRMAFAAAKSVTRFLASGLKTAPTNLQVRRLETCAPCSHYTGSRCRLCGCFTRAKAIMPHEDCPVGKWPS
jgi:tetratricopeptide (TPR) repeat protein